MKYKLIKWSECAPIQKFSRIILTILMFLLVSMAIALSIGNTTSVDAISSPDLPDLPVIEATLKDTSEETSLVYETFEEDSSYWEYEEYKEPENNFTDGDIEILAKTLYGEANCVDDVGKEMVVWCILNRLDSGIFGDSITEICTAPYQFEGYHPDYPITDKNLAIIDYVIDQWELEKIGYEVDRVLPSDYLFFVADSDPEIGYWKNLFYKYTDVVSGDIVYY